MMNDCREDRSLGLAERMLRALISGIGVKRFAIALNNAFVHGDVIMQYHGDFDASALVLIYDGIEKINEAGKFLDDE